MPPQLPRASLCPPCIPLNPILGSRRLPRLSISRCQKRHATLIRRPLRPYMFTQLVTLTDGSAVIQRTTSPTPVYKSIKDSRNHPMWNPSSQRLANMEDDDAGRLRAFRRRFGRGWDAETARLEREQDEQMEKEKMQRMAARRGDGAAEAGAGAGAGAAAAAAATAPQQKQSPPPKDDIADLMDLISGFETAADAGAGASGGGAAGSIAPTDSKPVKFSRKGKK